MLFLITSYFLELQIIGKEGGLRLKDNFEGGATWAYEVGSESTVCPIIVEDLNQPRQMLVEVGVCCTLHCSSLDGIDLNIIKCLVSVFWSACILTDAL